MTGLSIENVAKTFAVRNFGSVTALDRFSIEVRAGELLVLLGPSGCGKTTLLRLIAGADSVSSGRIMLNGESIEHQPPHARSIGMAFQHPALLPQLTVEENILLGPKLRKTPQAEAAARAQELAQLLEITHLLCRFPETLSGGEQQRVSLARALVNRPAVLLLDEPLASLDAVGRRDLREAIRAVQQQLAVTTVYVTHDQAEAAAVADRIALMSKGELLQVGSATELYQNPARLFVAEFFGPERPNILSGEIAEGHFQIAGGATRIPCECPTRATATGVIRPRSIRPGGNLTAVIHDLQHTGWSTALTLAGPDYSLRAELPFSPHLRPGDPFRFSVEPADLLLFEPDSGLRVGSLKSFGGTDGFVT